MSGIKTKPADVGDKLQYLVHEYNDNMVRFLVHYPGVVDAKVLCAAVKTIIEKVEVLHGSFFTDAKNAYWRINEDYTESDFFVFEKTDEDVMVVAKGYFITHIEPCSKVQLRCYLIQNEKESVVVFLISHLCMDGGDSRYLLGKIAEAYNRILTEGNATGLEIKNGSRAPKQAYESLSRKEYLSLFHNPISRVKSAFPYPTKETGVNRLCTSEIAPEVMKAAGEKAKVAGASINDVLLTACYHAYATLPGTDAKQPMSIMSMFDLRKHCKNGDSAGLCNMSGSLPTTLQNGIGPTFSDTLHEVVNQTKAIKEDPLAGLMGIPLLYGLAEILPMGVLSKLAGIVYGSFSIGVTNLGNLNGDFVKLGQLTPDKAIFGGPLKKKPGMQVSIISLDGRCSLSATGDFTEDDANLVQILLGNMAKEIKNWSLE